MPDWHLYSNASSRMDLEAPAEVRISAVTVNLCAGEGPNKGFRKPV